MVKHSPHQTPLYDRLFAILLIGLACLVVLTFKDYGISHDEDLQSTYGHLLLSFYVSGLKDTQAFSYENLYYYGGLFDLVSAILVHVSPLTEYDTRHLLCAIVGLAGIVGTWRVARLLAGPRAGLLAAVLLALTGAYYGAMFNNTKDVPFAAGMIWVVYFGCRLVAQLPKPSYRAIIGFGAAIGLSLGIRVGALFGGLYILPAIVIHLVQLARSSGPLRAAAATGLLAWRLLPGAAVAVALMALLWPWSVLAPGNIFEAVTALGSFDIDTTIAGETMSSQDIPRWYLPWYLVVKLPELVLLGGLAALAMLGAGVRSRSGGESWREEGAQQGSVVVLAAALPILYAVLARPGLYNGIRHFLFVVPPLCVMAAYGFDRALINLRRVGRLAPALLVAVGALFMTKDLWTLIALHPQQYVYYNLLVGGVKGAAGRYEMDYWSNFAREAIDALVVRLKAENGGRLPDQKIPIADCFPDWILQAYAPPQMQPESVDCEEAQFVISTTNTHCDGMCDQQINESGGQTVEPSGQTIISIERLGAVLGVVKDLRPALHAVVPPPTEQKP